MCLSPTQELLSACGGDLCSALPWLALLSADFSYNALTSLDSSLVSAPSPPLSPAQGRSLWGGKGWVLREECQLFDRYSCEEPFCASFPCPLQRLLSALRFLNLSHNHIQDCKGFLMVRVSCQLLVDLGLGWFCSHSLFTLLSVLRRTTS